jgi:hypothetical protein
MHGETAKFSLKYVILRRTQLDMITNVRRSASCQVPSFLSDFN